MTLRSILVHLDPATDNGAEINAALRTAEVHDAHLAALATATDPELPLYGFAGLSTTILDALERQTGVDIARVRTDFERACQKQGRNAEFRASRLYDAETADVIATHGRHADLVIMRQSEPSVRRVGGVGVVEGVVVASGGPVLVVPYAGAPETFGSNIIFGWDGSREAARALKDAMPFMRRADKVHVLVVNPDSRRDAHGELPGADISTHLARHGLNVELSTEHTGAIDAANLILSRAADYGADMLVMGAFAHSRLQQTLFGGFTTTILRDMTVPVLLSH